MPKLKATTDASGNVFYPVTIAEGIYDNDNSQTLDETLSSLASRVEAVESSKITAAERTKLGTVASGAEVNVQSNWNESNSSSDAYIQNKPVLGTAAGKDVATSGNASTSQVVMGNDTRLSDARPASDVSAWAKASTKPTYSKNEIGLGNVDNTADVNKSVAYAANAGTVNSHTVNADVPSGAVFTDTTYSAGTAVLLSTGTDTTERTWQAKIIADYVKDNDTNLLDLLSLAHDYTFKKRDCIFVGGLLYRCTSDSTTKPPFDFVFDSSNRIVAHTINGQDAVVCSSSTLNTGWEKVMDISDRYYVEDRIKNRFDIITDTNAAVLGNGYGVCDTEALTTAKTVSIGNFILKTNGIISVRFTNAIGTADSTLNVSGTGAKAIRINGSSIQPGVVRPGNTVMLQYDGTYWNIVNILGFETSGTYFPLPDGYWVDLGLPSGLKWANRNMDASRSTGFASSAFRYGCSFFSWGNTIGDNPIQGTFIYNFGTSNDGPYASTEGAKLTGNIPPSLDAARVFCGAPWRMPTSAEFQELFDNCDFVQADGSTVIPSSTTDKRIEKDGIVGIYLRSKKNGNLIFFACSGYGVGKSLEGYSSNGYYWSSSLSSTTNGYSLGFDNGVVYPQVSNSRFLGFCIRPVF